MRMIYNKYIPFKGFAAINLFGILFVRDGVRMSERSVNHEAIHSAQILELAGIIFYIWYLVEWLIRLCLPGDAYRNISFEREAYINEHNLNYLKERKHFSWFKYL